MKHLWVNSLIVPFPENILVIQSIAQCNATVLCLRRPQQERSISLYRSGSECFCLLKEQFKGKMFLMFSIKTELRQTYSVL